MIALKILSEVASVLRREGRTITKPKRSKGERAKALCVLGKHSGIRLCVSPQEVESDGSSVFELVAFGAVGRNVDTAERAKVHSAWRDIQRVSEQVVTSLCSSQIVWLTVEELDARAHQESLRR